MFHVSVVLFFSFLLLCGISLYEYVAVHFGDKYLSFQFFSVINRAAMDILIQGIW